MKSKSTQKTEIPKWLEGASEFAVGRGRELADRQYQGFNGERIAGLGANEVQAQSLAGSMAGKYQPLMDRAGAEFNSGAVQKYQNPYIEQVLNSRQRRLNQTYDDRAGALKRNAGMRDAFGTDRGAILESRLQRDRAQANEDLAAEGYNTAYQGAVESFFRDRAGSLDAARQGAANDTAAIGALQSTGMAERSIRQSQNDFNYGQFLEQRDWGVNNMQPLLAAIGQARTGQTVTSTQQEAVGPALIGLAGTVAGAFLTGGASLAATAGAGALGGAAGGGGALSQVLGGASLSQQAGVAPKRW